MSFMYIFVAGCRPPLLPLCSVASITPMRLCLVLWWWYVDLCSRSLFSPPPILLRSLGVRCRAGEPGRRDPGTEHSGVVEGCGERYPCILSLFLYIVLIVGLLETIFLASRGSWSLFISLCFYSEWILYPIFCCTFTGVVCRVFLLSIWGENIEVRMTSFNDTPSFSIG